MFRGNEFFASCRIADELASDESLYRQAKCLKPADGADKAECSLHIRRFDRGIRVRSTRDARGRDSSRNIPNVNPARRGKARVMATGISYT